MLSRGGFIAADSLDSTTRHLFDDIEENYEDYADYYREIGLRLEAGNGYYFFSPISDGKQIIEQKLDRYCK